MILRADKDALVERLGNIASELGEYGFWKEVDLLRQAQQCLRRRHTANRRRGEKEK